MTSRPKGLSGENPDNDSLAFADFTRMLAHLRGPTGKSNTKTCQPGRENAGTFFALPLAGEGHTCAGKAGGSLSTTGLRGSQHRRSSPPDFRGEGRIARTPKNKPPNLTSSAQSPVNFPRICRIVLRLTRSSPRVLLLFSLYFRSYDMLIFGLRSWLFFTFAVKH